MSQTIPTQHPAVVLRSHYNHLRALLAGALIALLGLTAAIVILATDNDGASTSSAPAATAAELRVPSHARIHGGAPVPDLSVTPSTRYDDGRGHGGAPVPDLSVAPAQPGTRYDGGPDEGTTGPGR